MSLQSESEPSPRSSSSGSSTLRGYVDMATQRCNFIALAMQDFPAVVLSRSLQETEVVLAHKFNFEVLQFWVEPETAKGLAAARSLALQTTASELRNSAASVLLEVLKGRLLTADEVETLQQQLEPGLPGNEAALQRSLLQAWAEDGKGHGAS